MFSRSLLVGLVAVCASVASATTTKIKDFNPTGGGLTATPHVDGMAIIKYDASISGSHIHIHMQDLGANETYGIAVIATNSGDFDYSNPLALTTNPAGNGTFETDLPTIDLGAHPTVYIYLWDGASDYGTSAGFDPAQYRAVGSAP